ncbi:MAG TPA: hypothetical protein VNB29_03105 [Chthoniobacterales bacterium]|nr:hypothetical protein [Chthoniobacterales bacterium]
MELVLAGAEAELFGAGARDDEFFAVEEDLDVGVVDLDEERAVAADDADDGGRDVRDAGGFTESKAGGEQQYGCGSY